MLGGLVGLDVVGLEVSARTSVAGDLEGLEVSGLWLGDTVGLDVVGLEVTGL